MKAENKKKKKEKRRSMLISSEHHVRLPKQGPAMKATLVNHDRSRRKRDAPGYYQIYIKAGPT